MSSTIVVTGGTGSLGQVLLRHYLADESVTRLVCLSRDELKQAELAEALHYPVKLKFFLGDVRDEARLRLAFSGATAAIHCAALKRVDKIAYDPHEAVKTNVLGSINVVNAAIDSGVTKVLLVSSDKAVEATNFYGQTKAIMEGYGIAANSYGVPRGTRIAVARWGNVLGSRGSVVHLWRRQAAANGRLFITHLEATRFWITLDEAVAFIVRCLAEMTGGELYVPKLRALRMLTLGEAIWRLARPTESGPPTFVVTGLRPGGEKLHEALVSREEEARLHDLDWGYLISPHMAPWRSPSQPWPGTLTRQVYRSDWPSLLMSEQQLRDLLKALP